MGYNKRLLMKVFNIISKDRCYHVCLRPTLWNYVLGYRSKTVIIKDAGYRQESNGRCGHAFMSEDRKYLDFDDPIYREILHFISNKYVYIIK